MFGIGRVHVDVDDAGLVVEEEDLLPGLAAVGGLEQAAFLVGAVEPAQGADVDDVGIFRMDGDAADLEGLLQAHVLPGLAAVGGLVNAVAVGDGVAWVVLAGADPDDVAVGGSHADRADGDGAFAVELVVEGDAVVDRLEQSARSGGDPVGGRVGLEDGQRGDAAAHRSGPDRTPGKCLEPVGIERAIRGKKVGVGPLFLMSLSRLVNS